MQNVIKRIQRQVCILLVALLVVGGMLGSLGAAVQATPSGDHIVISQVYGGGGNSGAELKHDFIELYNPTDKEVNVTGWKVRYASAANSLLSSTNMTVLSGIIKAEGYILIQEAVGSGGTKSLPAPDVIGTIAMSGTTGKVELVNDLNTRIDLVSFGPTATEYETAPTAALSNSTAAIRKTAAGAKGGSRGEDTDDNSADFEIQSPAPRNSSYGFTVSPVAADPAPNAWPAGTSVSLSSPTAGASVYAAVYGAGGTEGYEPYTVPISIDEATSIKAYASAPGMAVSPGSAFNYTILEKANLAAARTAVKSQNVWTEGVVTHIDGAEMYIQDDTAGLVLYGFPAFAEVGDLVEVRGFMDIYSNLQEIKPQAGLLFNVVDPNAGMPVSKVLTAADLSAASGELHEAELVAMENVTIVSKNGSTVTASQGDQEFIIYSSLSKLEEGKIFERMTGVIKQFNDVYQFIPLNENALVEKKFSVIASPKAGRIIIGSPVTLSSPASGAAIYYTMDGSDPTTASQLYSGPITVSTDAVIKAVAELEGQTSDVYTFAFEASEALRIHDIQGESHTSEFSGQTVKDVEGIVTQYGYTFATGGYKGFFMQDSNPDDSLHTSEGIFVYTTNDSMKPAIGDLVTVTGTVSEYNEGSSSNLKSTQITMTARTIMSSGNDLPEPVIFGKGGRAIPSSIIDNDDMKEFQPEEDAIDFYESMEGMLVKLPAPTILSPYWTSGSGNSMLYNIPTRVNGEMIDVLTAAGGLVLKENGNLNPQRLLIAYGNPGKEVNTGDKFDGDVTGVIGYNNGNFKIIPAWDSLPTITGNTFQPETSTIAADEDKLIIASYNIENYFPGVGAAKIDKLADSIANNLKKPDIIGVVEMQDSNGETNNGTVEASAADLVQAIKAAGGPDYLYTDIAPENNKDGGAPGGNIRVGFLYNPARVSLASSVNGQKGTSTASVGYDAAADELTYNPGRIEPMNTAFESSRKPLAAQFIFRGEKVIVIANHFNSKSGDNRPFGSVQPPVMSSEAQRHQIGAVVNGFVKNVLTQNPQANIVALGDLNDFQFSQTAAVLKGNELDNLIDKLPQSEQYTYTYDGNSQVLDHILVSKNLTAYSEVDIVHLNADFSPSRGRVSDHDAVMAQIDLKKASSFTMTLMHVNDTHAHLENVAQRKTAIKEIRAEEENTMLLDAGDVFSGTLFFNKYLGQADLAFMNDIGYDAMVFGNHEFDKGPQVLADFVKNAKFPIVSANIDFSKEPALNGFVAEQEEGKTAEGGKIYDWIIKVVGGEKVGVFGLTTEDTKFLASPGDNILFENYLAKAEQAVAMLEGEGVNKIIALTHLGYEFDKILAEKVGGIDVIVGGHSHTNLPAPVEVKHGNVPTIILQAEDYGKFLGRADLMFDREGVLTSWEGVLLDTKKYAADTDALAMLAPYNEGVAAIKAEVIGKTDVLLDGERNNVRSKETNLGSLMADGMLAKVKSIPEFQTIEVKGFVAIQNGGGIRTSIPKTAAGKTDGDITLGELLTVMPFGNNLTALRMTGQEIIEALENGVSGVGTGQGRFPQVSGMRYYYDSTKKPEIQDTNGNVTQVGERVIKVEIKNANGTYSPVDPEGYYFVATNSFMANGGDFYRSMKAAKDNGRQHEINIVDYEVFWEHLDQIGTVKAETEGRIVDLNGGALLTPTPSPTPSPTPTPTPSPTPTPTPIPTIEFLDAADHWAVKSIKQAVMSGIIYGYGDGTFRPTEDATRAQFVTMVGRAFKLESADGGLDFADAGKVPAWARGFYAKLIEEKIISGYEDDTLRPSKPLTRTEMTVILVRALGIEPDPNAVVSFADANDIPAWARPYIAAAYEAGLIEGVGGNRFAPQAEAMRAEVVTLLLAALEYKKQ